MLCFTWFLNHPVGLTFFGWILITMSKVIQKKNHWITKVHEFAVSQDACEQLNLELFGGAENGEFPYIGKVKEDVVVYKNGQLSEGELLLEVEGLPVSGLPLYDIMTVIRSCKGPIRLKSVRQGRWWFE